MLPHPSCKRRSLDGAQSIAGEPEVRNLTGPPAECHEESPFIFKATDLVELIGKLGAIYLRGVRDGGGRG